MEILKQNKMINIQKISKLVLLGFIVTGFWACNDNDPETFEVIGEVITSKRIIDGEEKFALSYYAYSNMKMDSAKVNLPGDSTLTLSEENAQKITYYYEPSDEDFSTTAPESDAYEFLVTNKDVEYSAIEDHVFTDVDIPTIDSVGVSTSIQTVYLEWNNNDDAENYVVLILNEDDETIFISYLISGSADSFTADENSGTWDDSLDTGSSYTVEVQAIIFEDDATNADYFYQIETKATASEEFTFDN